MSSNPRILVVDDRKRTARIISRVLEKEGFEVATAFDGATGLEEARQLKPDLIILDIMMPGLSGYEVCQKLQADPETAHTAVIFLTGKGKYEGPDIADEEDLIARVQERLDGFESGAVEFLTKPVSRQKLLQGVETALWASGRID